ncbi:efflux transporter outer membrane subunit [Phenylobacterium sp.]|uniref:efflux transporter outer membrane subunit n=1 Tax=Phenylobacterium sp. TaxID=1871053 RepID=UPI0025D7D232|nr:efflux transporter outer membrane subunit [Phenylobacterium sp.]
MGLLAGCAAGPNYQPPPAPKVSEFTAPALRETGQAADPAGAAQTFDAGKTLPAEWWRLFASPQIDALVKEAIANNPDLRAAQSALAQSRELLRVQRAAYLPTIGAGFDASRSKNSATIAPPLASNASIYSLYTAQVTISYAPDVFGGVRRQVEAARARVQAADAQADAAYLTLTSNVVQAALQEASLRGQIAANQDIVGAETKLLDILRLQERLGEVSAAEVAAQESALAQAQQALPPLNRQLASERDLLAILLGRYPSEGPATEIDISSLELPRSLPVSIPAALVEHRPDVRAAEANLHAANAQIGIAAAARLPTFSLGADGGSNAARIAALTSAPNSFWSLTAGVAQPIFQGGALRHQQRAAEAGYAQALAQYRSAALSAYQGVADALQALQIDADALQLAVTADRATTRTLQLTEAREHAGEISASALYVAQQAAQQSRIALIQARTSRFTDTVALFQALGAGPWAVKS